MKIFSLFALVLLAAAAPKTEWVAVDAGLYTASFPTPPTKTETKESMVTNVEYRAETETMSHVTSHFAIPKAAFAPVVGYSTQSFAEKVFNEMIKRDDAFDKILTKTSKKGKRQHLIEYSYLMKNGKQRDGAIIISRSVFYQYSTSYPKASQELAAPSRFADSFALKEGLSIPRS